MAFRLEAIAFRLEAIAFRLEAIPFRLEAIVSSLFLLLEMRFFMILFFSEKNLPTVQLLVAAEGSSGERKRHLCFGRPTRLTRKAVRRVEGGPSLGEGMVNALLLTVSSTKYRYELKSSLNRFGRT